MLRTVGTLTSGLILALPLVVTVAAPTAAATKRSISVELTVVDVTPSAPARTSTPAPLTITVTVRNSGGTDLKGVSIRATRGTPIVTQTSLTTSIKVSDPTPDGLSIKAKTPVSVDVPAGMTVPATFSTTTSILDDGRGLCLCDNVVYPIRMSAYVSTPAAEEVRLDTVTTYVPSILRKVTPVKVSWVWPLIDRPHRLAGDTVFFDDILADSVSGGRLDNALRTLELLDDDVPVTVVIDPELLDELEVMATGKYQVRAIGATTSAPGSGQIAARDWLTRLKTLLADSPALQVVLTPLADPALQALTHDDLSWSTTLSSATTARISDALVGRPLRSDIAWPAEGAITSKTLDVLAEKGSSTVLLSSSSVAPSSSAGLTNSVAVLRTPSGPVTAAMTDPVTQRQVALATDSGSNDATRASALPILTASLAVRAIQAAASASYAVLTPPRYVNADAATAARTINETSSETFSLPSSLRDLAAGDAAAPSRLTGGTAAELSMPAALVSDIRTVIEAVPAVRALLSASPNAEPVIAALPAALQRLKSTAWRSAPGNPYGADLGIPLAAALSARMDSYLTGVRIVSPSSGSYTLGSTNSNLPVTVENTLPYTVRIQVQVTAVQGLPGYTGKLTGAKIAPNSLQTVQVASRVERSGRIPVEAQLLTTNQMPLGNPVPLSVDSTVFGVIGVLITVIAGGILVIALLVRLVRRVRRRRRRAAASTT